ncbi:MAG: hypothetical protein IIX85_00980 [Clostridia bacterium]|jgi:hypothetical protein|nr:hypothetical protein [Clostridia bacterium]
MRETMTNEEIIDYITLKERTPENLRRIVAMNRLMAQDPDLRRRVETLEAIYDALALPRTQERLAFLQSQEIRQEDAETVLYL